jgi:hypothetical protein
LRRDVVIERFRGDFGGNSSTVEQGENEARRTFPVRHESLRLRFGRSLLAVVLLPHTC